MLASITLKQLETFIWVAALGNFRKTAERLFTTQPAISSRIANLEDTLGVRLFERDTGSIRLTSKGQELLPYAEQVLRATDLFREKAGNNVALSGILRLGVSETIVQTWLPAFLASVHEHYPDIDVELSVDVTTNLRNELVNRSLDLAFLLGPVSEYNIENFELISYPLVWAASPGLDIPVDRVLSREEMAAFPLLTYARNTRPYEEISQTFKNVSDHPARLFPSSSLSACLRMTLDSIGVGSLPRPMIAGELKEGRLVEISCEWTPTELGFTASYPTNPYNPLAQVVVKNAQAAAADYVRYSSKN